jgi:hypothetical protein
LRKGLKIEASHQTCEEDVERVIEKSHNNIILSISKDNFIDEKN